MGSRSKWEDMVNTIKEVFTEDKKPQEKAQIAAESLGSGLAGKASSSISNYQARQKKAMEDAGI
jgi:hypothetical protein